MIEDAELLRRYAEERSEEAFAELVRRHLNLVYSVALRQVGGDAHRAQDVAQEVFSALARKAAPLARRPVLGGWLYRTAQFTAIDLVRVESRRQAREQKAEIMHEPSTDLEEIDGEKLRSLLDQTMSELDDTDRDAVWLRFFADLSFGEVGSRLRLTENAARMRVGRALEKMHAALSRRGVTSTTAAVAVALTTQVSTAAPAGLAALVTSEALAGAAAIGGSGAVLTFMSMGKLIPVVVTILAAAGVGYWHQRNDRALQHDNTVRFAEQNDEIARLRDENQRLAAASAQLGTYRTEHEELARLRAEAQALKNHSVAAELTARSAGAVKRASGPTVAAPVAPTPDKSVAENAAVRTAQDRRLILRRYDSVFQQLGLSSEKQEKLTSLLIDEREASVDFAAAAASTGADVTQDRDLFARSVYEQREQIHNQMKDLLGEETYAQFEAANEGVKQSAVIDRLQKNLKGSGAALNPDQTNQLLDAMSGEGVSFVSEGVVNRAGQFLTPAQLAALQTLQQRRSLGPQKDRVQEAVRNSQPAEK